MAAADVTAHKGFTVFSLFVIVASLFIIGFTFFVSMGAATSSGFARGQNLVIPLGVVSVLPTHVSKSVPVSWFISRIDSITGHRAEMLAVQDAGRCAGDTLPHPNVPVSVFASVAHDGKLVLSNWSNVAWEKKPQPERRSVAVYFVAFENNSSRRFAVKNVENTMDLVRDFFSLASSGRVIFELTVVQTVILPQVGTNFSNVFSLADRQAGYLSADHYLVLLPSVFHDESVSLLSGFGEIGGSISWIKGCCIFSDVARGLANNLGLLSIDVEDESTITCTSSISSGWIGLSAPQLVAQGWLPSHEILTISTNGTYRINSLSSNNGIRTATIPSSKGRLWLEWREPINQDRDVSASFLNILLVRLGSGLLKMISAGEKFSFHQIVVVECLGSAGSIRVTFSQ